MIFLSKSLKICIPSKIVIFFICPRFLLLFFSSYGYRNPHTPDDSSIRDHRMYSQSIFRPSHWKTYRSHSRKNSSHRIYQVSRRRSPRSRIPDWASRKSPLFIGDFLWKEYTHKIAKSFDFIGKKHILNLRTDHPSENASTTRRSCEVSRDNSWSSGRRDTIRLYRQICRPYPSHPMSPKTHAQKVRRKNNLARRRSLTGSVISWVTNVSSPDTSLKSLILYSFSFLVLALIISLIILAIYGLIA